MNETLMSTGSHDVDLGLWSPPRRIAAETLTAREHDVLRLLARGFSYDEIGSLLGVTIHTVRSHVKGLYAKLGVHSRSEAIFEAITAGLLVTEFGKLAGATAHFAVHEPAARSFGPGDRVPGLLGRP